MRVCGTTNDWNLLESLDFVIVFVIVIVIESTVIQPCLDLWGGPGTSPEETHLPTPARLLATGGKSRRYVNDN